MGSAVMKQVMLEPVSLLSCVMLPKNPDKEQEKSNFNSGDILWHTRCFRPSVGVINDLNKNKERTGLRQE